MRSYWSRRVTSRLMPSVAFICTANRCRSIMAHAILVAEARKRSLAIDVYSAGIRDFSDQPPLDETSSTCLHFNTPPPKLRPTWVGELPLRSIDRFLVMEQFHAEGPGEAKRIKNKNRTSLRCCVPAAPPRV